VITNVGFFLQNVDFQQMPFEKAYFYGITVQIPYR
jgi:hypothetical protein